MNRSGSRRTIILHIDLNQPAIWSYAADTTAEKRAELRKGAVRFPEGIRIVDVRQADDPGQTEGEAVIRFFRRGYTVPTVIHLAKEDRVVTLVFNPFLRTVNVYDKDVDFSFNPEERKRRPLIRADRTGRQRACRCSGYAPVATDLRFWKS